MSREQSEKTILEFWEKNNIFQKSVEQRPAEKQYVFYDGPPFATGLPHYGHILGMTCKDVFPRFWTMKGFRVERRWGWDCHGLPIENIAEKELGIKQKKEIESMGIAKFNEFCASKVLFFAKEWKKTVTRMGKWIEFENAYKTMDQSYMESVWFIFKKLFQDGYIYEGKKILLYCPRCETPLANAEIAMDNSYKTVTEKTAVAKFKLKDEPGYILAWTTTPWTLIGNVALAVNPQLTYVKVQQGDQIYYLAKDRLQVLSGEYTILQELKGNALVDKQYEPLYHIPSEKKGHYIIAGGDQVSAEEGTGIVHMAIYGEFDYAMIQKYDLPVVQHVGPHGKITLGPEKLRDLWFKKADKHVIEDLEERNLIYSVEDYSHSYPFCYRCETPLFYNAVDSWFVDVQRIKPKLLERNHQINWYPSHLKDGRFKYILETAPDWSISRNRYWATAIPVWKCPAGHKEVIGSIKELQEKASSPVPDSVDLHKHVVDNIQLQCHCGKTMTRIPEVIDCWFESGAMPYASEHYPFEHKDKFIRHYPGDFVSEYISQVRAWFYYMHVLGVLLFDRAPFKNILVSGMILAEDGSKMSKSKKNFPDPAKLFEQYGADALRYYLMASPLLRAQDLNFREDGVKEVYRRVVLLMNNVAKFYELFCDDSSNKPCRTNVLDRWIVSKTAKLVRDATRAYEEYDTIEICALVTQFIEDLSTWYVRRSRERCKTHDQDAKDTLGYALLNLTKIIAPIAPFIAEETYQLLKQQHESVHLDSWPEFDPEFIEEEAEKTMDEVRRITTMGLDEREKAKIPVRQALSKITVTGISLGPEYTQILADELNVKEVVCQPEGEFGVVLDTTMTPELQQEGLIRELSRKINDIRKAMNLTVQDRVTVTMNTSYLDLSKAIKAYEEKLLEAVHADNLVVGQVQRGKEVEIAGEKVNIEVTQIKK